MAIDLNSDMGEGFGPWTMGDDAAMLDIVTSANVACGWHAGDPNIMVRTAALAKAKGVAIGAHPGFGDLWGFGRRTIRGDTMAELERMVAYQIGALQACAALAGHRVTHVKAHGALANLANDEDDIALAIGRAVKGVDRGLSTWLCRGSRPSGPPGRSALRRCARSTPTGLTRTTATSRAARRRARCCTTPGRRPSACCAWSETRRS